MEKYLKTHRSTLNDRKKLTTTAAKRYYGVLIKCCGASPRKAERETFIYHFAVSPNAEAEYVFKGSDETYWKFISDEGGDIRADLCKDNKSNSDLETEARVNMILRGLSKKIDVEFRAKDGIEFKRK